MSTLTKNRFLSLALLGIVLPMGFLIALKAAGILSEPKMLETITVPAVGWNMSRPSDNVDIVESVENSFRDDKVLIGISVNILDYYPNDPDHPAYGNDLVDLGVTAELEGAYVYSLLIKFSALDPYGFLRIESDSASQELRDLQIIKVRDLMTAQLKAYVEASPLSLMINQPKKYSVSVFAYWILIEQSHVDHLITVSLEVTYYDGTAYKMVEIPVMLKMETDAGDTFDLAKHVEAGFYRGCLDDADTVDIFSISIPDTMIINITMTPCRLTTDFNLFLYDASRTLKASSTNPAGATEYIVYTAQAPFGNWYIKAERSGPGGSYGNGIYNLTIVISSVGGVI